MTELDANFCTLAMAELNDSLQWHHLTVLPQTLEIHIISAVAHEHLFEPTASSGDMRPSGTTLVASIQIDPAPRVAKPCLWKERKSRQYKYQAQATYPDVNEMPIGCMSIR
jgi:hypothetical protein